MCVSYGTKSQPPNKPLTQRKNQHDERSQPMASTKMFQTYSTNEVNYLPQSDTFTAQLVQNAIV